MADSGQTDSGALASRVAWQESDDHKRVVRTVWAGASLVALMVITGASGLIDIALYGEVRDLADPAYGLPFVLFILAGLSLAIGLVLYSDSRHRVFREKAEFERLQSELRSQVAETEDELSLSALWNLTQTRLDYYHRLATSQSTLSFNSSLAAMVAGFMILLATGIAAAASTSTAGSIAAAAVGIVGGGISGFISSTFLRLQETSAAQLRTYFVQPVQFLQFLAAERLVGELGDDSKDEATKTIISSIVGQHWPIGSRNVTETDRST